VAGPHRALVEWYEREHARLGTDVRTGVSARQVDSATGDAPVVVQCTGSRPGRPTFEVDPAIERGEDLVDVADLRRGVAELPPDGPVVVHDPIGGPIAIALAEELEGRAILVTPDNVAGNELSRTGDLAPANTRLQQLGVTILRRSLLRLVRPGPDGVVAEIEDRYSGERTMIDCGAVVDCGFRLPDEPLDGVELRAGDAVAPRTVHEAVLEGRRVARTI
jgi:2,4-dienoyl-CoA reductase (NADPH2)